MNKQDTENLLNVIQKETGVSEIEMASKSRVREIVWSRYLFNYFAKDYLNWTQMEVYLFLNKDRTTMLHADYKHKQFLGIDRDYTGIFHRIREELNKLDKIEAPVQRLNHKETINAKLVNKRMLAGIDVPELVC